MPLRLLLALSIFTLSACAAPRGPGGGDGPAGIDDDDAGTPGDTDGDGLSDAFEALIYTDPELADTDGDGFDDAFEHLAHFWARDANDFPYTGGYPRGPQPDGNIWDGLSDENGWDAGDFSGSWTLVDQHGEDVKLKRFYGQVIMIDVSAEWCGPCRQAAETLPKEFEARVEDGFVVLQLLIDGLGFGDRNPDVVRWAETFGLPVPVLDDRYTEGSQHYLSNSIPTFTMIGRDFVIDTVDEAGFPPPWSIVDELLLAPPLTGQEEYWPMPENEAELREDLGFGDSFWRGYAEAMQ